MERPQMVTASTLATKQLVDNAAYKTNSYNDYGPFDTLPFVANQQQYAFFTQPVGSNGKTKFDTNMVTGSQFPLGRNVVVKGIGFHFLFSGAADSTKAAQVQALYTLLERSYIEFVIQGRQFEFQAPGSYWLPEVALSALSTTTAASTGVSTSYERIGDYIKHGGYKLAQPITLQNLVPFEMDWNVNLQSAAVQSALDVLIPSGDEPASIRWQLLGHLEQGT